MLDKYYDLLFNSDLVKGGVVNVNHGSEKHRFKRMGLSNTEEGLAKKKHHVYLEAKKDFEANDSAGRDSDVLPFVEFMRVNMRLAEDRILSFVTVFATGYGTKWTQGPTFYYQPEVRWTTLLLQRRRWINGTLCSFAFFFTSNRAFLMLNGGLFDSYKIGKSTTNILFLWSIQVVQTVLVFIAPSLIGVLTWLSLNSLGTRLPGFEWAVTVIIPRSASFRDVFDSTGDFRLPHAIYVLYMTFYICWMLNSFRAARGIVEEWKCWFAIAIGFIFCTLPISVAVWYDVAQISTSLLAVIVITMSVICPLLCLADNMRTFSLFIFYSPFFFVYCTFFSIFIPHYAFARIHDTT